MKFQTNGFNLLPSIDQGNFLLSKKILTSQGSKDVLCLL